MGHRRSEHCSKQRCRKFVANSCLRKKDFSFLKQYMRGFIFLIQWSVLCPQDSLLSRITPRYLKSPTCATSLSFITILFGGIIVFRKSMTISLVLSIFKTRWFILHQFKNNVISWKFIRITFWISIAAQIGFFAPRFSFLPIWSPFTSFLKEFSVPPFRASNAFSH